jgi:hypothetical protein
MPSITQLNPDAIIHRNYEKFLANSLGDETVMMNLESGDYLGVNSVGTDIWNLLNEPIAVAELIKKILEMYDVSEEKCSAEVNTFLTNALEQGMITVKTI